MAEKKFDDAGADRAAALQPSASATAVPGLKAQDKRAQQRVISQGLRQFFDNVVSEPIPDEFVALLQKMDEEKTGRSG
jgi:hypothetical protein